MGLVVNLPPTKWNHKQPRTSRVIHGDTETQTGRDAATSQMWLQLKIVSTRTPVPGVHRSTSRGWHTQQRIALTQGEQKMLLHENMRDGLMGCISLHPAAL
jgi:hypothetical protein